MAESQSHILNRRLLNAWISSVISISLVLLLVGIGSLLLVNTGRFARYIKENMSVTVLLKQDVGENQALAFLSELDRSPYIKSSTYISKEQGIKEMSELLGEDFLSIFSSAPIPISLDLTLNGEYVVRDSMEVLRQNLMASPLVDNVTYQEGIVEAMNQNLGKISLLLAGLIGLFLVISFALINNTIRLSFYVRRFSVHTMQLVGATRSFIRRPFLIQALMQALVSVELACAGLVGLLFFLHGQMPPFFEIFPLERVLIAMGIVLASGLVICLCSAYFTVGQMLGLDRTELYY